MSPPWLDEEDATGSSSRSQHHGVEITLQVHQEQAVIMPKTHPSSSSTAGGADGEGSGGPKWLQALPSWAGRWLWTKPNSWVHWLFYSSNHFATLEDKHNDGFQSEHLGDSRQYWRDIILGVNDGTFFFFPISL
jgi:hypothetical protein